MSAMLGLVRRDKFAKTNTLDPGDVKPLKDDFAGCGFISKEMVGIIVFKKLTAPCRPRARHARLV